jgi:hypothetical protein
MKSHYFVSWEHKPGKFKFEYFESLAAAEKRMQALEAKGFYVELEIEMDL